MVASPESNLIADIVKQGTGLGSIDHLAQEASYLLGVQDFRTNKDMADGILGALSAEDEDLLKTLIWAERTNLDVDGDGTVEVDETKDLIMSPNIFVQLAATYMDARGSDLSFDELNQSARATAAKSGIEYFGDEPVVNASLAGSDPAQPDLMQFAGEQPGDPAAAAGDLALSQGTQDPVARYKGEAQYLGENFGSLDADQNGTVDDAEFKAAISGSDITALTAASIALEHNLVTVENDVVSNLTIDQVVADYHGAEAAVAARSAQSTGTDRPAFVPEGSETGSGTEGSYYQFNGEDGTERPAYAPEEGSETPEQAENLNILNSKTAPTKERLRAIAKLVESGKATTTITDSDGAKFDVRMEVVPIAGSSRTMVHMFATDPQTGKEFVVLRAIKDGDDFTRQRDASGNEVDFAGTRWRQNRPDSMFLQ